MNYPEKESSVLEFKRELPAKHQIIKTIIGFCNMHGGRLIVGIDDSSEIIGVAEQGIDEIVENLHRSIYSNCSPTVIPSIHLQRINNKVVLVIEVSEGMTKPYFIASETVDHGAYVRIGTQTVKATPEMIRELQWKSSGKYADEMPLYHSNKDNINIEAFEKFLLNRKNSIEDFDLEKMLFHYNILIKEHTRTYATIGGMLLFGNEPQKFLSESFIICTHFLGTSGREVVATKDCTGPLLQQYRDCISFILSRLNRKFTIEGIGPRMETLEIPENALREIVINAIVHRNYLIKGPTKVAIYDDRLEIFSPGVFPGPIQIDHLNVGVTYIRNSVITRVFRETGHIEKLGSGFIALFDSYQKYGLPTPIVHEGTGFVKCVLPRPGLLPIAHEEEEQKLLQLFLLRKSIKTHDVMHHLSISRATANRYLKTLLEKNLISKFGKGPSTYYAKK